MSLHKPLQDEFRRELFAQINDLAESADIESPFTAKKLADKVNLILHSTNGLGGVNKVQDKSDDDATEWKIFNLLDRRDILFPQQRDGKKPRYLFTRDDLRSALAIFCLRQYGIGIEDAVEYTKNAFDSGLMRRSTPSLSPQSSQDPTITDPVVRARRYVWTRSLQHVLSLFFDTVPKFTAIVVDRTEEKLTEGIRVVSSLAPAWETYSRNPDRRVVAQIHKPGLPYFKLSISTSSQTHQPGSTVLLVADTATQYTYRIQIIWPHQEKQQINARGSRILKEKAPRQLWLISGLLRILFEKFEMPDQATTLDAMATAITQVIPEIDACCILSLESVSDDSLRLIIQATSEPLTPTDLPEHVTPNELLLAWVYEHRVPLFINHREKEDARIPDLANTTWTALAALPVVEGPVQDQPVRDIVFVGRRRALENEQIFAQPTRDLLSVLAGIVNVVNESERSDDQNIRRRTEQLCADSLRENPFDKQLAAASTLFFSVPTTVRLSSRMNVVTVAFSISNFEDIARHCGAQYASWLEERFLDLASRQSTFLRDDDVTYCKIGPGQFVIVIQQSSQSEDIYKNMSREVTSMIQSISLRHSKRIYRIAAHSWVLYFPYSYLQRKVSSWKPQDFSDHIRDRTEHALRNLARIEDGNEKLRMGYFQDAEVAFRDAISEDKANPNLFKYLGETLFFQQKYSEAKDALEEALNLDPQYPGARILKAQTLAALGDADDALKEYQSALEIKITARYLSLYGEELLQQGKYTGAIQQFSQAKELVKEIDPEHATQYDLKIGEAYLGEGHAQEAFKLFTALRENPQYHVLVEGSLRRARQAILQSKSSQRKGERNRNGYHGKREHDLTLEHSTKRS